MGCNCGKPKCDGKCGISPAVLQINNPTQYIIFHKVDVPTSMGDSTTNPPKTGAYKNVLLYYEADQTSWLYSSDGIPVRLTNGITNYEDAINLPQINGETLIGDKSSADLKLADAPMVITIASGNTSWSGAGTAEDIYNFFLNQGNVNVVFEGSDNYGYGIVSAAYIPGEQKMMCMTTVAGVDTGSSPVDFAGNALYGLMTFYTAGKAVDVGELDLQLKLSITDFTGLNMTDGYVLEGVPATVSSIGMVKPGDGLEVASDGTLSVNTEVTHTFDTVADMKASTELKNGDYAQTLGFHTLNDGGGATYYITDSGTADEMQVIAIGPLYANLVIPAELTPEQVGCYGDGTHDDTTQFKKLITFVTSKGLPLTGEGIYLLSEAITIGNIDIVMPMAKLLTNYGITINGATNRTLNLPKVISSVANANYAGITMFECYTNQVTVNYIEGFTKGFLMTSTEHGCVYNTVNFVEIKNCLNSIVLEGQDNGWVNQNLFFGGRIWTDSSYTSTYGADIVKISLLGTSVHGINNNIFINTCIEGDEGSSGGLKLKLRYASTNKFECVRFEGQNSKVDALNSNENILSNGYNVINLTFVNDPVAYQLEGTTYNFPKAGRIGNGVVNDIQVTTGSYPIIQGRNTSGQIGVKLLADGIEAIQFSSGNPTMKLNANGLSGYDNSQNNFVMLRAYGGHTNLTNADGTNHCVVIAPGGNTNNGAFLWVYDGHLYGKMGSKPSSQSDGTVIL